MSRPSLTLTIGLFHTGCVVAIAQVAASIEVSVTLSSLGPLVRSLVLLMYPIAVALLGVGAAAEQRYFGSLDARTPLRLAGVAIIGFLLVALRYNFVVATPERIILVTALHIVTLGCWFLCLGAAINRMLREAYQYGGTALAWSVHALGLFLGYVTVNALIPVVGVNALLLTLGLSLLVPTAGGPAALGVLAITFAATGVDGLLEDLREVGLWRSGTTQYHGDGDGGSYHRWTHADDIGEERLTVHLAWSRFGQFRLSATEEGAATLAGWYNFHAQWDVSREPGEDVLTLIRRKVYEQLPPRGRIAIMGVGAGRGLLALPFPPHPGILAIEINPNVIDYFTRVNPEANRGIFGQLTPAVGDGRHVVSTQPGLLDAIVIESARYTAATTLLPASAPLYHYTSDAIAEYVGKLSGDGVFIAEFTDVEVNPHKEYLPAQVMGALRDLGVHVSAMQTPRNKVLVIGCKSMACAARFERERLPPFTDWTPSTNTSFFLPYRLTDDTPFAAWGMMGTASQRLLLAAVGALAAISVAAATALDWQTYDRRAVKGRSWNPTPCMFAIGAAHTALTMWTCHALRTYYGDGVLTVIRALAWLALYGALGSALAPWMSARVTGRLRRCIAAASLAGLHIVFVGLVPFHEPSTAVREVAAALLLLPGGLAMGAFFPTALAACDSKRIGTSLLADALGTLAGYLLLFLVALPFGLTAFSLVALVAWVAAAALLPGLPERSLTRPSSA